MNEGSCLPCVFALLRMASLNEKSDLESKSCIEDLLFLINELKFQQVKNSLEIYYYFPSLKWLPSFRGGSGCISLSSLWMKWAVGCVVVFFGLRVCAVHDFAKGTVVESYFGVCSRIKPRRKKVIIIIYCTWKSWCDRIVHFSSPPPPFFNLLAE